ncbi:amidohydrolase [Veronia nyctiphanis]|uniref:Amidohydrolase n=1 Tax=Veronia nyctiphanis TaxID=1278244 RepID=A0A4Q0YSV9_9GAMM|nr:CIA30 family protein [Veronia nyctiphanis]RXJ74266.1 amidohydrolase [Veronia nyctiphanis]
MQSKFLRNKKNINVRTSGFFTAKGFTLSLAALGMFAASSSLASEVAIHTLMVENVSIYQPHLGSFSTPSRMYIDDGKIVKVTTMTDKPMAVEEVYDAEGQYALPGLIDLHVHLSASGSNYDNYIHVPVQSHLNSALYYGVTGVTDLLMSTQMVKQIHTLEGKEPDVFLSGPAFTNPGGHGTQFGPQGAYEVVTKADVEANWSMHLSMKPSVTKAIIEDFGGSRPSITDEALTEIGKRSKEAGLPLFIHVSTLEDGKRAIKAGADALAHGINQEEIDEEFIRLMLENNVTYIPTLSVYHNPGDEAESGLVSNMDLAPVHQDITDCLFKNVSKPSGWQAASWEKKSVAKKNVALLAEAGVKIGAGSDAGNPFTLHGAGLIGEIVSLSKAGLSNPEALNAATLIAAKTLGEASQRGELIKGAAASFTLLDTNPIENIESIKTPSRIYHKGSWVNRQALVTSNQAKKAFGTKCVSQEEALSARIFDKEKDADWVTLNDSMFGGTSTTAQTKDKGSLVLNSTLAGGGQFGAFTGSQMLFDSLSDATHFEGISITYKSSHPVFLSLYMDEVKDWNYHNTMLNESDSHVTVTIPFTKLTQMSFGQKIVWSGKNLKGLSLLWRNAPGGKAVDDIITAEIESISFY